jgi:hypothetical protein
MSPSSSLPPQAGVDRDDDRGPQIAIPRPIARLKQRLKQPLDLVLGEPAKPTLRLPLQPDLRHRGQDFPLLVRDPQKMAQQRQRAIDGRGGQRPFRVRLADLGRQPLRLVLAGPARGEILEPGLTAEGRRQTFQRALVLRQRARGLVG